MKLNSRLEKLEAKAGNDIDQITAIFRHIVHSKEGKPYQAPIAGWKTYEGEDIMRLEDESDESLAERATSISNKRYGTNKIHRFIQIEGEDENIK